jgi:CYTH domain-containing protein
MNNTEIERKFLVDLAEYYNSSPAAIIYNIKQGYLFDTNIGVLRFRQSNNQYFLTIKNKTNSLTKTEVEFEITKEQADALTPMVEQWITKTRYDVYYEKKWEVDFFLGNLDGLVLAEIELDSEDEVIILPSWIGKEVTQDTRYSNSNLIKFGIPQD